MNHWVRTHKQPAMETFLSKMRKIRTKNKQTCDDDHNVNKEITVREKNKSFE